MAPEAKEKSSRRHTANWAAMTLADEVKRREQMSNGHTKAGNQKISTNKAQQHADGDYMLNLSIGLRVARSDPEVRDRVGQGIAESWTRADVREKRVLGAVFSTLQV